MADVTNLEDAPDVQTFDPAAVVSAAADADLSDRRRPGRSDLSAQLIPMLRDDSHLEMLRDDAAPMRGIAVSIMLSAPIYVGIWLAARWAFF